MAHSSVNLTDRIGSEVIAHAEATRLRVAHLQLSARKG
jgi:hypothetical protein